MMTTTLFLAGDVMTGRGLDQAMQQSVAPTLHEPGVRDARRYLALAEAAHGPILAPVSPAYLWGDALAVLEERDPAARIINLETSVTMNNEWCRAKDVHYRMHPANISCLTVAGIQVAGLANNHTLDWGRQGLAETLGALQRAGIQTAGAGQNTAEASLPAIVPLKATRKPGGRVLVWAVGSVTSGIPGDWAATNRDSGIDLLPVLDAAAADRLAARVAAVKQPGDIAVISIHWGSNWGFDVPDAFIQFAHQLIEGGVDLVHGHSSHHVRPIEVYRDRLILYGCGDLIDDYEGIAGHGRYRSDLGIMYFPTLEVATGRLVGLAMVPMQMRQFRLSRVDGEGLNWLRDTLSRISQGFGCSVEIRHGEALSLRW
jgi:poly-gamma-glutamate capsule biosynthesis protein CapA/YwtB (metallophosphatase superfamily)